MPLDPPPSEMTYEAPQTRLFLQQYLLNSLCGTNNVYVKIKILKIFQVLFLSDSLSLPPSPLTLSLSLPSLFLPRTLSPLPPWTLITTNIHACCVYSLQSLLDDGHIEFKQNLRKHPEAFNEAASMSVCLCVVISVVWAASMLLPFSL